MRSSLVTSRRIFWRVRVRRAARRFQLQPNCRQIHCEPEILRRLRQTFKVPVKEEVAASGVQSIVSSRENAGTRVSRIRALARHSSHSASGCEPQVMPPPTPYSAWRVRRLKQQGANGHVELGPPPRRDETNAPGVDAPGRRFKPGDDFHCPHLRRAGDRGRRERARGRCR